MKEVAFFKMSGAGNDFVVFDNRSGAVQGELSALVARLADRKRGVGGDGVLFVEPSGRKHFRMRYFNADGSEADMCGNGGRCIARFAAEIGAAPAEMAFENLAGDFSAKVRADGRVELAMTAAHSLRMDLDLPVDGNTVRAHFVDTGVPHLVVPVPSAAKADLEGLGPKLRRHPLLGPKGANVNFAEANGPASAKVRTFERGVEGETLACGTGSVASAIVLARLGLVRPPVAVTTTGGDVLDIAFVPEDEGAREVVLTGPAEITFRGTLDLDRYL